MKLALSYQSKRELVQQIVPRYQEASRARKILMLDAFVDITGYVRTYAIHLNHPGDPEPRSQQARLPQYGSEVQQALLFAWKAANQICAKRLIPFLPTLVEAASAAWACASHGVESRNHLLFLSATTADRFLSSQRTTGPRASPPCELAPYSKARSQPVRSSIGTRHNPAFSKQNGRAHCGIEAKV